MGANWIDDHFFVFALDSAYNSRHIAFCCFSSLFQFNLFFLSRRQGKWFDRQKLGFFGCSLRFSSWKPQGSKKLMMICRVLGGVYQFHTRNLWRVMNSRFISHYWILKLSTKIPRPRSSVLSENFKVSRIVFLRSEFNFAWRYFREALTLRRASARWK